MGKMDWKDKHLEELLRDMPKINDNQNPHELYQIISLKLNKRRTIGKLIPSMASVALIILFLVFGKDFIRLDNQIKQDSSQESKMMNKSEEQQISFKDEANSSNQKEQFDTMMKTEPLLIKPYLLLYQENKSQPMFVQAHEGAATFEEAILLMQKDEPNQGLTASIPPELLIGKVSVINDHVSVQLSNRNELLDSAEINFAFEAILLSAKEFGYSTVEFNHDKTAEIGAFPLNKPIEVPIAANNEEIK